MTDFILKEERYKLPVFNLPEDTITKLKTKFLEFQNARKKVHEIINDYVADYRQFTGSNDDRKEFLEGQFNNRVPNFSHLIFYDNEIFWHVSDIALILGRNQSSISRTLSNLENSDGWCSRLIAIRKPAKSANGNSIFVYQKDIFDLIIDHYEDEYLLRFSNPRWGDKNNAPNIQEIRRFWDYLKKFNNFNLDVYDNEKKLSFVIPPMTWKDIFSLIWEKVFNVRIFTVCSAIFAVCFEIARRVFGFHLWLAVIPAVISIICVILIHKRKFTPDTLSNIGASALLIALLWISAALSIDRFSYERNPIKLEPTISLVPALDNFNDPVHFTFNSNVNDIKEIFFRISPDIQFHSTGFLPKSQSNNIPLPSLVIPNDLFSGNIDIFVKFISLDNIESDIFHFSFNAALERIKIIKNFILKIKSPWLIVENDYYMDDIIFAEWRTFIKINTPLLSKSILDNIEYIFYKINDENNYIRVSVKNINFYDYKIGYSHTRTLNNSRKDIQSVTSYLTFYDGSSSDIRISKTID